MPAASSRRCPTQVMVESGIMSAAGIRSMGGILSLFPHTEPTQVEDMGWDSQMEAWSDPLTGSLLYCSFLVMGDALHSLTAALHGSPSDSWFLSHFMLILASSSPPEPAAARCVDASPNPPCSASTLLSPSAKLVIS